MTSDKCAPALDVSVERQVAMKPSWNIKMPTSLYKKRKQTVEPVFGIIKSAMGFVRFRLRGLRNVATEWALTALAYNCRRIARLCRQHSPPSTSLHRSLRRPNPTSC
jgi:hypothetical protein